MRSELVYIADMLQITPAGHAWVECCSGPSVEEVKADLAAAVDEVYGVVKATRIRSRNTVVAERIVSVTPMEGAEEELIDPMESRS